MFTGIVTDIGIVEKKTPFARGREAAHQNQL